MATYPSILTKSADAIAYAFTAIADADLPTCTVYKDYATSEITTPAVIIECNAAVLAEDAATCSPENFAVEVSIRAETQADDQTRTTHAELGGIVEAVFFRTAGDVVTSCNAGGVSAFTAYQWKPLSISTSRDDARRQTTITGRLICASR